MKTVVLALVGLMVGAAGYWWAYGADTDPAGAQIGQALTRASAAGAAPGHTPAMASAPAGAAPARRQADTTQVAPPPAQPEVADTSAPLAAASEGTAQPTLLLPVQGLGREALHDTFTDARTEGRVHDAIDIMAPAGTPVLAVADGTVEKLFDSKRGGLTIYQFEPSGHYAYYYAHLQRYADGVAEKQPIHRGQVIGYVGSTGNASAEAPHLHFAIFRLGPERHWWEGEALNPYPILHDGRWP